MPIADKSRRTNQPAAPAEGDPVQHEFEGDYRPPAQASELKEKPANVRVEPLQVDFLHSLADALNTTLDLNTLMHRVADLVRAVIDYRIFAILLNTLRIRGINLEREEVEDTGPLAEVELLIPNMVCEGCASKISTALTALPGVREVRPKVAQKHVSVRYEPAKVQELGIKQAVEKAGFTAVEV